MSRTELTYTYTWYLSGFCVICGTLINTSVFQDGWTSLMWAAAGGYDSIVKLLLGHGANVNLQNKVGTEMANYLLNVQIP